VCVSFARWRCDCADDCGDGSDENRTLCGKWRSIFLAYPSSRTSLITWRCCCCPRPMQDKNHKYHNCNSNRIPKTANTYTFNTSLFDMKTLNNSKTVSRKWPHRLQSAIKGQRREKHARTSASMKATFYIYKIYGPDTRPALMTVHRPSQRPRPDLWKESWTALNPGLVLRIESLSSCTYCTSLIIWWNYSYWYFYY